MKRTKKGIRLMYWFFSIVVFYHLARLASFYTNFGSGEITRQSLLNFSSSLCLTGLIGFFAFLLLIYGLKQLYEESEVISNDHDSSVTLASLIFVIGFLLGLLVYQVQVIAYAIGSYFLVKELAGDLGKNLLRSAAGINIIYGVSSYVFLTFIIRNEVSVSLSSYALIWLAFVVIVGYSLFVLTYRKINKGLDVEEDEGSLKNCPKCGENALNVYPDGSMECENCDYPNVSVDGGVMDE